LPVLVLLSCSLIIPALLIVVTLRYYAKELSQQHNSITFKKSQSYLQWWYAVVVELLELWMRSLKKKITKSLTGMCHPNKMGFHPFILHFIQATAECFFFFPFLLQYCLPLPFFFFFCSQKDYRELIIQCSQIYGVWDCHWWKWLLADTRFLLLTPRSLN